MITDYPLTKRNKQRDDDDDVRSFRAGRNSAEFFELTWTDRKGSDNKSFANCCSVVALQPAGDNWEESRERSRRNEGVRMGVATQKGGMTASLHCAAAPVATISFVYCFISSQAVPRLTSPQVCVFFFIRKAGAMPLTFAECRCKPHVTVRDKNRGAAEAAIVAFRWGRARHMAPFFFVSRFCF